MADNEKSNSETVIQKNKTLAVEIASSLEALITAVILAFVIRAFVMEAYRIPTGSMADTLMGAHYRLQCVQCGHKYNYGFVPEKYGLGRGSVPQGQLKSYYSRCPSCGYYQPAGGAMPVSNGDRILVLKCLYQFFEPNRWDVIVFKNPLNPKENYIKRLVGQPGETVEIIDGDVYIDGKISRKPPKLQKGLWMPVYDNDCQPVRPLEGSFNGHIWEQPFRNILGSSWTVDKTDPAKFCLDDVSGCINELFYDTSKGNDFRANYAYNDTKLNGYMPYCSDLMVRFYTDVANLNNLVGISLSKYNLEYKGWVDTAGQMTISKVVQGRETVLAGKSIELAASNRPIFVKFENIDHRLTLQFADEKLVYDLGGLADDAGTRETDIEPEVKIFGSGKLTLSHVAIYRDIHYTGSGNPGGGRATEGRAFKLGSDEFFVLGDNSPNSEDGRWWDRPGVGNNSTLYREGVVPHDYLVGKAIFVYWAAGFKPFPNSRFACISNIGDMRFIHGGSSNSR